jgi:phage-related baseplate assembly protein
MNLSALPDVTFAQSDIDTILKNMINDFEQAHYEQTGEKITLYPGDKRRIFLYTQALREFQLRQLIDFSAKQNLLKYSSGDYLDNVGAFSQTNRLQESNATVPEKFNLSIVQNSVQIIPKGTRVGSSGSKIYFAAAQDIEVPAGETSVTSILECTTSGSAGNGFVAGQLNVLVDPLPWIESVTNTDTSQGGADKEEDDRYRERIWEAPEGFSVAGPTGAYEALAKKYSSLISDVKAYSPTPGVVDVRVLLSGGEIPTDTFLQGLYDFLSDKEKRPLTDKVTTNAPEVINYDINFTYYIFSDDATSESTIKTKVDAAVQDYILWQKSKLGRDINIDELISRIKKAGAKRLAISSPAYTALIQTQIAIASTNITINYGGLEDD